MIKLLVVKIIIIIIMETLILYFCLHRDRRITYRKEMKFMSILYDKPAYQFISIKRYISVIAAINVYGCAVGFIKDLCDTSKLNSLFLF